jgi:hypothetical protein
MSRLILNVSFAAIAFIVGVATSWSVNAIGGFAIDRFYSDASIPGFARARPSDIETWNRESISCNCGKREVANSCRQ